MEKKVSVKGIRSWVERDVSLYGLSFDTDKIFGLTINDANKIQEKICEIAKKNKETMVFDYYGDVTKSYIDVTEPNKLYYSLMSDFGFPVELITEKHREYLDSLFSMFCDNINCYKTGIMVMFLDGYYNKKKNFKKTEKYLISVQSSSDVITNSSSELFCIVSDKDSGDLYNLLREYADTNDAGCCSGDGGEIDVDKVYFLKLVECLYGKNNPNINKEKISEKFVEICKECYGLPINGTLYEVNIDHAFTNTMDFITNELKGKLV